MQLHVARLCLDCEEVHDARTCPRCTSESFALLSRWVPVPERRARPRTEDGDVETYRKLLEQNPPKPSNPWLKGGAMLAAVSLGGWLLRRRAGKQAGSDAQGSNGE